MPRGRRTDPGGPPPSSLPPRSRPKPFRDDPRPPVGSRRRLVGPPSARSPRGAWPLSLPSTTPARLTGASGRGSPERASRGSHRRTRPVVPRRRPGARRSRSAPWWTASVPSTTRPRSRHPEPERFRQASTPAPIRRPSQATLIQSSAWLAGRSSCGPHKSTRNLGCDEGGGARPKIHRGRHTAIELGTSGGESEGHIFKITY